MTWTPERLKALRKAFGDTQIAFAERVGVSRWAVVNWETGGPIPLMACKFFERLEKEAQEAGAGELQTV